MDRESKLPRELSEDIQAILNYTQTESCSVTANLSHPETGVPEEIYETYRLQKGEVLQQIDEDVGTLVYPIGSMTKLFIAVALHLIVDIYASSNETKHKRYQKVYHWNLPFVQVFNEHSSSKMGALHGNPTLLELLLHMNGLPDVNHFILSPNGKPTRSKDGFIKLAPWLSAIAERKAAAWLEYSNGNYILIAMLIEAVSGVSLGHFLKEHVLDPLEMDRTFVNAKDIQGMDGCSRAFPYLIHQDGVRRRVEDHKNMSDCIEIAAFGIYSCTRDVARLYREVFKPAGSGSSYKILNGISAGRLFGYDDPKYPESRRHMVNAGLGDEQWVSAGLVTKVNKLQLGSRSTNRLILSNNSASTFRLGVSKDGVNPEVCYQAGSVSTYACCSYLVADTGDVVIVMTNTLGQGDAADWISRVLLQYYEDLKTPRLKFHPFKRERGWISEKARKGSTDFLRIWRAQWEKCHSSDTVDIADSHLYVGMFTDVQFCQTMEISSDGHKLSIEILELSEASGRESSRILKRSGKMRLARCGKGKLQICPDMPQIDHFAALKDLTLSYETDNESGRVELLLTRIQLGEAYSEIRYVRQSSADIKESLARR